MKITIIGAGNMGTAVASAVARNGNPDIQVIVSNPSQGKLDALRERFPSIEATSDNAAAARGADMVVLAVKPGVVPAVMAEIGGVLAASSPAPVIVSLAAGVSLDSLSAMAPVALPLFRLIPNTAATLGKSMTFIAHSGASPEQVETVVGIASLMGRTAVIEEAKMEAATALASCGIAYFYKFVQAMTQAGVELGLRPADAQRYASATMEGATAVMLAEGAQPQSEIDKVTTPGGMTIRGVNALDHAGFTSAVIKAVKASLGK